jgi:uncharacterized tellurite resistance protein B-like protein
MSLENEIQTLKCPYCANNPLETTVSMPIIEGQGLWHVVQQRQLIGCCKCIESKIKTEAKMAKKKVNGSPSAYVYSFFHPCKKLSNKVRKDVSSVRKILDDAGISELPEDINHTEIGYSLAVAMIKADGRIEEDEVNAAIKVGKETFSDFDEVKFRAKLNSYKMLPSIEDLSLLLKIQLNQEGKAAVIEFLVAICVSDGDIAKEEITLLQTVAKCLDYKDDVTKMLPKID